VFKEGPNIRFRVVQRADHKIWVREMFSRINLDYFQLGFDEEIRFERNAGIWDEPWEAGTYEIPLQII